MIDHEAAVNRGLHRYGTSLEPFKGPRIVTVGVISGNEILTGQRRDNGLWTNPGGHMDPGETPKEAACREVLEEAGISIQPSQLEFISQELIVSHRTGKEFVVFAFLARVPRSVATAKNDPDKEITQWKWVPISRSTPELRPDARHAKVDAVLVNLLGG